MSYIQRFLDWLMTDPTIGILLITAALLLFSSAIVRPGGSLVPLLRNLAAAAIVVALLLGLLWAFRTILRLNSNTFDSTHGQLSYTNEQSAQSIWGKPHIQRELVVDHYIIKTVRQEIPNTDPSKPTQYKDVEVRQEIPQNTITSFKGVFGMTLNNREKGYALYNGYVLDAKLDYAIVNDSDIDTQVDYTFPLSSGQKLYENFQILFDGQDIASDLRYGNDLVTWHGAMTAHQHSTVSISYRTRGMDYFYYQIPAQRAIDNFSLELTIDRLPTTLVNYPDGILAPTKVDTTSDGQGSVLTWTLNQAITTAGMGIALPQPEQHGADVSIVLSNSLYGLTFLIALVSLTILILGQQLTIIELALITGAYAAQALIMATFSDFIGFWPSLILGAALVMLLAYLLFRHHPSRLLRILVLVDIFFCVLIYPVILKVGTTLDNFNFDNLIRIVLFLYVFALVMYVRSRTSTQQGTAPDQGGVMPGETVAA